MSTIQNAPLDRKLISIPESADVLGVSPRTIRNLLSSAQLEGRYIGRRRLITVESINRLAATGTEAA